MAWPKLFVPSIPLADLSLLPQENKVLRKRDKVSILDLDSTVFIKVKVAKEGESITALERDKQINVLQQRLQEINQYKDQVKCFSENKVDLQENLKQIRAVLKTDIEFNTKGEALNALDKLKISTETLKFNLTKIDFTSINLKTRCEELMKVYAPHDFHYKLQQPIISASAKEKTYKFEGKSQLEQSKSACLSITKKRAWGEEVGIVGFAYGGLGMAAQEYTTSRTESSNRDINTRSMVKTNTAIATTKAIQEIAVFKCESVTLDKDAVNMARDIGKGKTQQDKELRALKFLNVYPAEINMGPFGIGGWFEYTATTTSSEMKTLDTMQQEAASQSANKLTVATKIFAIAAAAQAGFSKGDEVQVSSGSADTTKVENGTFTTTFEYTCAGPTVYDMNELNKNLNNPDNWSIFPSIAVRNHRFKRVDAILESLAAESFDVDEELINAAEIIRQIIDNGPKLVVREPLIPKDASMKNVIVFGKTGSGKSSLGNVLLGRYEYDGEDGFVVSNSKESCTKAPVSKKSTARKLKYYDTIGSFDTVVYKENVGILEGNSQIIKDIISIWRTVGSSGLHAILLTLNFSERLSSLEAKLAEFAGTKLFSGNAKSRILLIMTKAPASMWYSKQSRKEWLTREMKSATNHLHKFYDLVNKDPDRVIFIDCKMPQDAPKENPEMKLEFKKHNVNMAENVLSAIHNMPDDGVVVPVAELLEKENQINSAIDDEKNKANPDKLKIKELGKLFLC